MGNPLASSDRAIIKSAPTLGTSDDIYAVDSPANRTQDIDDLNASGTGDPDHMHRRRIIQSHGTCQVRC